MSAPKQDQNGVPYRVPPEPNRWPSIGLAVGVHALLLTFLWIGVSWQNNTPVAVEAEVWDMQTQTAAPPPPPPAPAPEPEPQPEPEPAPPTPAPPPPMPRAAEPPVEKPQPKAPDIALERDKKRKEELKRKEEQRQEEARLERERAAEQKRAEDKRLEQKRIEQQREDDRKARALADKKEQAEKEKRELEEKKAEQAKKEKAEKAAKEKAEKAEKEKAEKAAKEKAAKEKAAREKAEEAKLAKSRDEEMKRLMAGAGNAGSSGTAAQSSAPRIDKGYTAAITAKVKGNTSYAGSTDEPGNPTATFRVEQLPTGEIISVRKTRSSGVPAFDDAVEKGITKSSPLPKKKDGTVERSLEINFRMKDLQ